MELTLIDFLIGFFLMNAMPHLLVGLFGIRFLSAFGYKPSANLGYALLNVIVALFLFHIQHGIQALPTQGILLGALALLFIYLVTGRYFYNRFHLNK
ncbi:hypothetical protein [Candidatus Leptofilum sp.]|uniref:hypothetical protein n=1 Tax=Candidatus Leptofilum sp. TaxID=3241576 RepID=UPI003B598399